MANDASLPSLKPTRTHLPCGRPNAGPHTAVALEGGAFAIASGDHVEVLDEALQLQSTLLHSDAFPSSTSAECTISAVAFDAVTGRIAVASTDRIAIWGKTANHQYKVHSTFATGFPIECLDFSEDDLIVGGSSLCTYALDSQSGFASWSRRYIRRLAQPAAYVQLAARQKLVACSYQKHHVVQISRMTDSGQLVTIAEPWHSRPVKSMAWIDHDRPSDSPTLLTETTDAVVRLWRCLPDEPDFYVLWHTVNPARAEASTIMANIWIGSHTRPHQQLLTVAQDGHVSLTDVRNLDQPATTAARATSRVLPDLLPRRHLASLRYVASTRMMERITLLGVSRGGGLLLLQWAGLHETKKTSLTIRRSAPLRPRQSIKLLVTSEDQTHCISCGVAGETILWQCRRFRGRTGIMAVISMYRPETPIRVSRLAISPEGDMAVLIDDSDLTFLRKNGSKMERIESSWPGMPDTQDILAVAFDSANDGRLHLVVVNEAGRIFVWLVDSHLSPQLVCTSEGKSAAVRAAVVPQTASSSARIISSDEQGNLTIGTVLLDGEATSYRQTGQLQSGQANIRLLSSSTTHHVATLNADNILTIVNTQASLFTSGLEYTHRFTTQEVVNNIAFANTPTGLPILQVTLADRVLVLSQRRLDYYEENTLWVPVTSTRINSPYPITASAFTYNAAVFLATHTQTSLLSQDLIGLAQTAPMHLLDHVDSLNAPLLDYHPQFLIQLLLNGEALLVDEILSRLYQACRADVEEDLPFTYDSMAMEDFSTKRSSQQAGGPASSDFFLKLASRHDGDSSTLNDDERALLLKAIADGKMSGLSGDERNHLRVVIETVAQVEVQRRALDTNGMRFLVSLRSFAITQAQTSQPDDLKPPVTAMLPGANGSSAPARATARLRYRDNLWAFFSESQEILLSACNEVCSGPMLWKDARAFGLPLWIKSAEALAAQLETVARNEYTSGEDRDPTACSLYYFALRKKRLVQGLWRQATSHKERNVMIKFLMNDFSEPRWKTAALKNAYALMGKHRYAYAAAFFLLGDSLKDAVGVCLRQLDDFHLAIVIARVYEGDDGPVLRDALNNHVLPLAFSRGHRRLAIWAFWMLKRRDLAVRVIVTPMSELAATLHNPLIKQIGNPGQEDSSLVILYVQLRDWSLQTLRGSSAIPPYRETQFVLHNAQTLCRMGCHSLALDLVCRWEFSSAKEEILALASPVQNKSNGHGNGDAMAPTRPVGHHRRRSSLLMPKRRSTIILDVPSAVPSRAASPEPVEATPAQRQVAEEKAGFKKVLKEVKAAPAEFDMSAFGF